MSHDPCDMASVLLTTVDNRHVVVMVPVSLLGCYGVPLECCGVMLWVWRAIKLSL